MKMTLKSTLVLCDLDGLLLNEEGSVPQVLRDVLQLFDSRGGKLTVFSQRSPRLPMQAGDAVVRAIDRISRHRMVDGRHVDTDLMGPACFQPAFQHGKLPQTLQHPVAGVGILGVGFGGRIDGHLLAVGL